jgi:proteasome activator subunit 4
MASRQISSPHARFSAYGIFTREQTIHMISSVFRLLGVPVGPVGAVAYSRDVVTPDHCTIVRYRGIRTGDELCIGAARWIIYSLTDQVMVDEAGSGEMTSIWDMVESLLQAVESAFHPSNSGGWTAKLAAFVYRLAERFAERWTQEQRDKRDDIPLERRLTPAIKHRFVLSLRKVVFMSIYDKTPQASGIPLDYSNLALSRNTLATLAHLEPDLIIPGVLKRFYPSMQGLLEAHRTTASLASLSILMPTISRHKIYRNHVTTLLGLALPGIDPNDLAKTTLSLTFMIATCMRVPLWDLSDEGDRTALATKWVTQQMEILETMPGDDYPEVFEDMPDSSLTDVEFDAIARSSTGGLEEWITSFFNQIFSFLSNMPDPSKNAKTAEEHMVPMINLAVSTILASLAPALFTLALGKMQRFVMENVYHNAGEATASICRCFVEIRPKETLDALLGPIVTNIREEIDFNGAGTSGRITTTEVLPRDRTLLWNLRIFFALMGPRTDGKVLLEDLRKKNSLIQEVILTTALYCKGTMYHYVGKSVINVISSLTGIYTLGRPLVRKESIPS